MFQNLSLRSRLMALIAPPVLALGAIALYGFFVDPDSPGTDLASNIKTLSLIALATLLATALTAILVGRSLSTPLEEATKAAKEISDNRLPELLGMLRNPGATVPEFEPIKTTEKNEIGDLIRALNDVQESATKLAQEQQSMVRAGLRDLVVNMARRNQSLLDRQIEVIDRLESEEEDADRLEELYNLDHLATRMRRNSESLLVLAGADPTRRRGGPVAVADVLRVAMSEIENYQHIELQNIEQSMIGPQGAVDLAHLASELMENATQFSPPDTPINVAGSLHPDGSYLISISDSGIGMSPEQIADANSVLSSPPELGLGLTRSLGFVVIGRLGKRLGVEVELVLGHGGGTTAIIQVPPASLHGNSSQTPEMAPSAAEPAPNEAAATTTSTPNAASPVASPVASPIEASPQEPAPFAGLDAEPGEQAWTPPSMPERADNPFGEPATPETAIPAPVTVQAPVAPVAANVEGSGTSEALAKLLGLDPTAATAPGAAPQQHIAPPKAGETADEQAESSSELFSRPTPAADQSPGNTGWEAPTFDPSALAASMEQDHQDREIAPLQAEQPTAKLNEAVPTGEEFNSGMASLLEPPAEKTSTGLVKRNRSVSHAPVSEGRPVAASSRSPEEIRSMLARYRDGLKGKPRGATPSPPGDQGSPLVNTESNPFDNNPFGDQT